MGIEVSENDYRLALVQKKELRDRLFELRVKLSTDLLSEQEKEHVEKELKEVIKKMKSNSFTRKSYEVINGLESKGKR